MDQNLQDFADKIIKYTDRAGVQYCDVRAEQQEKKSVLIENEEIEHIRNSEDKGIGIRLIKNGVWSFCSITNPKSFNEIKNILDNTIQNSNYKNWNKKNEINLHKSPVNKKEINFPIIKNPEIEELTKLGIECNKIIKNTPKIIKSITNPEYTINSKYFVNSEGSEILQNFTDVVIEMIATAHESGQTQSVNITEGGRGGLELIENKSQQSAIDIAKKASELIFANPVKEVKNGYYISNMKIPSIDMKRYNWSISCQYAQKIENGEITDLLRDVIVMGTAPEFFNSIDACGNDFTVRPITNCGKGDPMQSMIMGNGGPTIRGIATVKSVN